MRNFNFKVMASLEIILLLLKGMQQTVFKQYPRGACHSDRIYQLECLLISFGNCFSILLKELLGLKCSKSANGNSLIS